jgi:hypothetical protein
MLQQLKWRKERNYPWVANHKSWGTKKLILITKNKVVEVFLWLNWKLKTNWSTKPQGSLGVLEKSGTLQMVPFSIVDSWNIHKLL